jgi:hypothetical protein
VAVAALVLGIIGTVCSLTGILFWLGIPLGLVGLILGIVGRKNAVANQQPTGVATAGVALGAVGLLLGLTMYVLCSMAAHKMRSDFEKMANDPKFKQQNQEFNDAFKKALEESKQQQQQQQQQPQAAPTKK